MLNTLKRKIALGAVAAVGAAGLVTIAAPAANAAAYAPTGITASAVARVGGDIQLKYAVTGAATYTDSVTVWAKIISAPAGATAPLDGSVIIPVVDSLTGVSVVAGASTAAYASIKGSGTVAAGTYSILVWTGDSVTAASTGPGASDVSTLISVTAGTAPASITLDATSASVATGDSTTAAAATTVIATIKDAAGNPTLLKNGETIFGKSASTGWVSATLGAAGSKATAVNGTLINNGTMKFYIGNTTATTESFTFGGSGLLSGQITAQTFSLSTFTVVNSNDTITVAAALKGVSASNGSYTAITTGNGTFTGAGALYASNATAKSITFNFTGGTAAASGVALAVITAGAGGLPTGVTAGTTKLTLDSTGSATFTVAATAAASGTGYVLNIGGIPITVTYGTPAAKTVAVTSPAVNGAAFVLSSVVGGSTTITAKVKDQYGDPVSGALVSFYEAVGTRNSAAAGTLLNTVTSDASGLASHVLKDASTSTTALTDKINVSAIAIGLGAAVWAPGAGAVTVATDVTNNPVTINYVASVTPAKVTVSEPATGLVTNTTACTATAPCLAVDGSATYSAVLTNSTGGTLSAGIAVTWTVKGGYAASLTSYTDANGKATLAVSPSAVGPVTVTATASGVTGSNAVVSGTSAATNARTIALDAATYAVTGGAVKRVNATVKDRWGNPMSGVAVTFTFTKGAGRFAGGALTYTSNTGTDGVAFADVAPLTAESGAGTMTASYTAADASTATLLGDGVTPYPAAVTTATAAVTVTAGGVSTDAATAAAQKATDAKIADIATAVTNLSTTVAGLVASLVAQIKDTKAAITATQDALTALAAVVNKIKAKVKA